MKAGPGSESRATTEIQLREELAGPIGQAIHARRLLSDAWYEIVNYGRAVGREHRVRALALKCLGMTELPIPSALSAVLQVPVSTDTHIGARKEALLAIVAVQAARDGDTPGVDGVYAPVVRDVLKTMGVSDETIDAFAGVLRRGSLNLTRASDGSVELHTLYAYVCAFLGVGEDGSLSGALPGSLPGTPPFTLLELRYLCMGVPGLNVRRVEVDPGRCVTLVYGLERYSRQQAPGTGHRASVRATVGGGSSVAEPCTNPEALQAYMHDRGTDRFARNLGLVPDGAEGGAS